MALFIWNAFVLEGPRFCVELPLVVLLPQRGSLGSSRLCIGVPPSTGERDDIKATGTLRPITTCRTQERLQEP